MQVLSFTDAGRLKESDSGQPGYVIGLLVENALKGSSFHKLTWASHKSYRPVKYIGAAEILAAGEAIDEGKVIARSCDLLLGIHIDVLVRFFINQPKCN